MTDEDVQEIFARLERIERLLEKKTKAPAKNPAPAPVVGAVASDRELDSKYGNPNVRRDPPRWDGPSFKGKAFSACSAEYLDELAGFLDWQANKDEAKGTEDGAKFAGYARKDAARARGWAERKRNGWKPAPTSNEALFGGESADSEGAAQDDDVPF